MRFTQQVAIPKQTPPESFFQELRRTGDQASAWVPLQVSALFEHPGAGAQRRSCEGHARADPARPARRDRDARRSRRLRLRPGRGSAVNGTRRVPPAGVARRSRRFTDRSGTARPSNASIRSRMGRRRSRSRQRRRAGTSCVVRSLTGEGGPEYVYRITIALREPTVRLVADASSLAIPRGSSSALALESRPDRFRRTDRAGASRSAVRHGPAHRDHSRRARLKSINTIAVADSVPEGLYSVQVVARNEDRRPGAHHHSPRPCP